MEQYSTKKMSHHLFVFHSLWFFQNMDVTNADIPTKFIES